MRLLTDPRVALHTIGFGGKRWIWGVVGTFVAGAALGLVASHVHQGPWNAYLRSQVEDGFGSLFLVISGIFAIYFTVICLCTYHEDRWALVLVGRGFRRLDLVATVACCTLLLGFAFYLSLSAALGIVLGVPIRAPLEAFLVLLGYVELSTVAALVLRDAPRAYLIVFLLALAPEVAEFVLGMFGAPHGVIDRTMAVLAIPLPPGGTGWLPQLGYAAILFLPVPWLSSRFFLRYE